VKSLHRFVNHFQYQINQPRQSFETTLSPRSHINSSIAFQYQINQPRELFETTLRSKRSNNQQIAHNKSNIINNINSNINSTLITKIGYTDSSITSNIKSISRDSRLKQRCPREVISIRRSLSNIKSISRDSRLKQRCARTDQTTNNKPIARAISIAIAIAISISNINNKNRLHRFVNHLQYQINQPRQSFETKLSQRSHIDSSIAF
jgi:hypothetical protein